MIKTKNLLIDKIGICLSVTCGLHCAATMIFLTFGTMELAKFLENEILEMTFKIGVLLLGIVAFLPQLFIAKNYYPLIIFMVGLGLLWSADSMTFWLRFISLVIGTSMIVGAHALNIRQKFKRRKC